MFELSEEQKLTKQSVHEFAKKNLFPKASYWDEHEEFPWESLRKMAEIGLTGLRLPSIYGGADADLITTGIAFEEVARYDHNCAIILCGCNITGRILLNASRTIQDQFLPAIVKGENIPAFAAMEADAGSNVLGIKTRADRQGDTYKVNGGKSMITFAGVTQEFVALVRTDFGNEEGLSCLFVEANRPGIEKERLQGFGWRATAWGNVAFDDVELPLDHLIGTPNRALTMLKKTVQEQRALTGLIALGTAGEAIEQAIRYAKIRHVFGKPLAKFEGIQFRLAEDFTWLASARLLCYQALTLIERGVSEASVWAAMANLMGGEIAYKVVNDAMDVYGGLGYSRELPFERYLRDIKATQLANATLKMEIGKGLLGIGFLPYA